MYVTALSFNGRRSQRSDCGSLAVAGIGHEVCAQDRGCWVRIAQDSHRGVKAGGGSKQELKRSGFPANGAARRSSEVDFEAVSGLIDGGRREVVAEECGWGVGTSCCVRKEKEERKKEVGDGSF